MTLSGNEVLIRGVTHNGGKFRPSDWAERLAGVLSPFHPSNKGVAHSLGDRLGYSPWCVPTIIDGVKCVVVNIALREYEPMAWDFVMNFARDNDLQIVDDRLSAVSK